MGKRRSRDELARDIKKMEALRDQNKTYREIADIMGYKSPGSVSDLLKRQGHFSVVLSGNEITLLLVMLATLEVPDPEANSLRAKLKKYEGK